MFNSKVICCFKWLGSLQLETLPAASFQLSNLGTGQEPNGLQLGTGCAPNITTDLYITSLLIATVNSGKCNNNSYFFHGNPIPLIVNTS